MFMGTLLILLKFQRSW